MQCTAGFHMVISFIILHPHRVIYGPLSSVYLFESLRVGRKSTCSKSTLLTCVLLNPFQVGRAESSRTPVSGKTPATGDG